MKCPMCGNDMVASGWIVPRAKGGMTYGAKRVYRCTYCNYKTIARCDR